MAQLVSNAPYLGDFEDQQTVHFMWSSTDSAGASITRSTDGEVRVYKDNGVSQTTVGVTDTEDFDSLTGVHVCTIATTDGFYVTGSNYTVALQGAVIDSQTVNAVLAHFSIENRFTNVNKISGDATAADNLETLFNGNEGFYTAYMGPRGAGVYLNDAAANTNTVNGVDGTIGNPVSTIGAAKTLADSMSLDRIYLLNDSSITLAATMEDYEFVGIGQNNQVNLGSQDVDNSTFFDLKATGTQGGTGLIFLHSCGMNALAALECFAHDCWLSGTNTLRASTPTCFDACKSAVAGTSAPIIAFPGSGTTNLNFRHYSGGLQVNAATVNDTMSYESDGQLIIDASCTSLDVVVRGNCSITDNGTTTVLSQDAAVTRSVVADSVWDEILTGATHNIATSAGRRLRGIQEFQGYENGAIWIDTVDGTAGTTDFENGTVEKPVNSIADANTLAASLKIERFEIAPGSSITLGAAQNNQQFNGRNWTLALNGQDIAGSIFIGATVSGVGSGTGTMQIFEKCLMGATSHIKGTHLIECGIAGTQTIVEAGDFFTDRCHSAIAGTATPTWDFGGALAASNLSFRNYSGGIEIQNMGAGAGSYTMSLEGRGQLIINANCSATSTVAIRGLFTVTDNASGAVTLFDDARFTLSGDADATWDETRSNHATLGTYGDSFIGLVTGSAEAGTLSTTQMTTDLSEATDEHYNGRTIVWTSGVLAEQASDITAYLGATGRLTYTAITEAPSAGDDFVIY
jgi:hypothetical protein